MTIYLYQLQNEHDTVHLIHKDQRYSLQNHESLDPSSTNKSLDTEIYLYDITSSIVEKYYITICGVLEISLHRLMTRARALLTSFNFITKSKEIFK